MFSNLQLLVVTGSKHICILIRYRSILQSSEHDLGEVCRWVCACTLFVLSCYQWQKLVGRAKSNLASWERCGEGDLHLHVICLKELLLSIPSNRRRCRDRRRGAFIHLNSHLSTSRHQRGEMVPFSSAFSFSSGLDFLIVKHLGGFWFKCEVTNSDCLSIRHI